jgi:hypothetical protein
MLIITLPPMILIAINGCRFSLRVVVYGNNMHTYLYQPGPRRLGFDQALPTQPPTHAGNPVISIFGTLNVNDDDARLYDFTTSSL